MFTWEQNFWSKFWQEPTHASKYWRVVKILTTRQNVSNRFDQLIFWVNVFFDKKNFPHTVQKFWCQFFASKYWRFFYRVWAPLQQRWGNTCSNWWTILLRFFATNITIHLPLLKLKSPKLQPFILIKLAPIANGTTADIICCQVLVKVLLCYIPN